MTPPVRDKSTVAMSIDQLETCSAPPLHDNPYVDFASADDETRAWLYNGTTPQSAGEVKAIAVFCVKQKLADALSWLVLQCELNNLDLGDQDLGDQDAQMIASWLERCPRPVALGLAWNDIEDEGAIALAGAVKKYSTLTSLDVSDNNIGDAGATAFADALNSNSTLTSLYVSGNNIGDTGATAFADCLKTNSTLTSLDVSVNNIGATGVVAFADTLETNTTLTSLDVSDNNIGATGATAFADGLKTNSTLTSLDVSGNNIGDTGATAFADALKINSTLTSLDVLDNNIGDTGVVAFADALETNTTLTAMIIGRLGIRFRIGRIIPDTTLTALGLREKKLGASGESAMASVEHRLDANKRSKPLAAPAAEALVMLASSPDSYFPSEVGALIVQNMITLGHGQGDGAQGLESLVISSSIVQKRELATEAFQTLPTSWESKLPPKVGAMIVENILTQGPDGVQGLESLVIASDIVKQRERDKKH
jgi:Ran GTPase-activating protein (RanGAP) involved in mRNA processing and transport